MSSTDRFMKYWIEESKVIDSLSAIQKQATSGELSNPVLSNLVNMLNRYAKYFATMIESDYLNY